MKKTNVVSGIFLILIIFSSLFISCINPTDIVSYEVTFDADGGSNLSFDSKTVEFATTYGELPTVSKSGYVFDGWWTGTNKSGTEIEESSTVDILEDQILYAGWSSISTITVVFSAPTSTGVFESSKEVQLNQPYGELPVPTKDGYLFKNWSTMANDTGTIVLASTTVNRDSNHTLYAKWQAKEYTITFDTQGGPDISPSTQDVTYDEYYGTLPTPPTWEGHSFVYWISDPNNVNSRVDSYDKFTNNEDITLFARWKFVPFIGPAGGWVFYENPNYEVDGWQYIEAAPYGWYNDSDDPTVPWGNYNEEIGVTGEGNWQIGKGSSNSFEIVNYHDNLYEEGSYYTFYKEYNALNYSGDVAAKLCADYSLLHNGILYENWFLPSLLESQRIFMELAKYDILTDSVIFKGGFEFKKYWTSSEYDSIGAYSRDYANTGNSGTYHKYANIRVRPVRYF